eukprot:431343_1
MEKYLQDLEQILTHTSNNKANILSLVFTIFDNIITEPNNKKYQTLNLSVISRKFQEYQSCINILFLAGFYKSDDQQKLLFNADKLSQLKIIRQILSKNNDYQKLMHQLKITLQIESHLCICDKPLILVQNILKIYNGNGACCDMCGELHTGAIWHCKSVNDEKHKGGFDVCCDCIVDFDPTTFKPADESDTENNAQQSFNVLIQHLINMQNPDMQQLQNTIISEDPIICEKDITLCKEADFLSKTMLTATSSSNYNEDLVKVLNAFHHLLQYHDDNNKHFQYLYQLFGGKCNLSKCNSMKRQDRNIRHDINSTQTILDTIHCHYQHGYDLYRLTLVEENIINDMHKNDDVKESISAKLMQLTHILNNKKTQFAKETNSKRFKRNKFVSNLSQMKTTQEHKLNDNDEQKSKYTSYSYSFDFNYWEHCKDSTDHTDDGHMLKDLYIKPKYNSLKEEVLNNEIMTISPTFWNNQFEKAEYYQKTRRYLETVAKVDKYCTLLKYSPCHPSNIGYIDGDTMKINHLVVIIIYCSTDQFQSKFSSTYRSSENDHRNDLAAIKQRHSNFHHFAKHMKEAIEVFGMEYQHGTIKRMYHGIDKQMVFDGMKPQIFAVLSTTSTQSVAIQFSDNSGLVLEMIPSINLKYFDCSWLSRFSNENECLFIGGLQPIHIISILNAFTGKFFEEYIKALRIIHSMIDGLLYEDDCSIILDINTNKTHYISLLDGNYNGINKNIKKLVIRLIEHQCSKSNPKKYAKFLNLHPYADRLCDQFFNSQTQMSLSWQQLNIDILKKYDRKNSGYIGYSFLSSYFCSDKVEGLKLEFVNTLFPSLTNISITNLSGSCLGFINDILQFICTEKDCTVECIALFISNNCQYSTVTRACLEYETKFQQIGWEIFCGPNTVNPDLMGDLLVAIRQKVDKKSNT